MIEQQATQALVILCADPAKFSTSKLSAASRRRWLKARTDTVAKPGMTAQLQRYFHSADGQWPMAAMQHGLLRADHKSGFWLFADPAHVIADMNTARLMAWSTLQVSEEDCAALSESIQPELAEYGLTLREAGPTGWFVSSESAEQTAPGFLEPWEALGRDMTECLPAGASSSKWVRLFNQIQMALHDHPVNIRRRRDGFLSVNALWFWGGGCYPLQITSRVRLVHSDQADLRSLALASQTPTVENQSKQALIDRLLVDARGVRDWSALDQQILQPARLALAHGQITQIVLDFMDGQVCRLRHSDRWRIWRPANAVFR